MALVRANSGGSGRGFRDSLVSTSSWQYVNCGFKPREVIYWCTYASTSALVLDYDVEGGKVYRWYKNATKVDVTSSVLNAYVKVDGTQIGFTRSADTSFGTVEIMAIA